MTCKFLLQKTCSNYQIQTLLNLENRHYLSRYGSDNGFKGTVVNLTLPSLHGGLHATTLTVLLINIICAFFENLLNFDPEVGFFFKK